MPATYLTMDGLLKDVYPKIMTKVLNNQVLALNKASHRKRTFEGRQAKFPAHVGRNLSARALVPGGSLAAAGNQKTVQWTVPIKAIFPHIRLTSDIMARTKSSAGAFARALAFETEGSMDDVKRLANRICWGQGDGVVALVTSYTAPAGVPTPVLRAYDSAAQGHINAYAGARHIRVGDVIDIYSPAGVVKLTGCTVATATYATNTLTLTPGTVSAAPVSGDYVFLSNPDGLNQITDPSAPFEQMGYGGIIDDGTFVDTLMGLSRTTYPLLKSQKIAAGTYGALGTLTQELVQRLEDLRRNAGAAPQGNIICHTSVRLKYLATVVTDRRYTTAYEYKAGIKENMDDKNPKSSLYFNEMQWHTDVDAPYYTLYMIPDEGPEFFEMVPLRPIDDGGGMLKLIPGTAGMFAVVYEWHWNLGPNELGPNRYGRMDFINATPDAFIPA